MKRKASSLLLFILLALLAVAALSGCGENGGDGGGQVSAPQVQDIGQGETVFTFEVTGADKAVTAFNVRTNQDNVGTALLDAGLIKGSPSDYGLYVTEVNGTVADYDTDQAYWAFYVDGEYATTGVDSTTIESGKTYGFVYTKD